MKYESQDGDHDNDKESIYFWLLLSANDQVEVGWGGGGISLCVLR